MSDGRVLEANQPCLKGGRRQPLSDEEMARKFIENARFGGWSQEQAEALQSYAAGLFDLPGLGGLRAFAG